ncbi:GNAT family N-acetyltransferase [Microbispora sp. NBC_01189]|uniref:GNAT family N-acetyltransferase n=1 Tax=Microbispora sp. NBC_01189 TaxID=2903583 RepID=UPI002E1030AF|nr:GNAT family N-acetyltransferase [Microbispora sp. NBC_01189]
MLEYARSAGDDAAKALTEEYATVYTEVYAEPPYNSGPLFSAERFLDRTRRQVASDGFELVSAIDRDSGKLAGFCFGLHFPAGRWWAGETTEPPAEVVAAPKVAVIELILRRPYRGHGYGKRLLGELLSGRDEPYAVLTSDPAAPAHAMYERWGWQVAGTVRSAPDAPLMDAMVLEHVSSC